MTLRFKINLIVLSLLLSFLTAVMAIELRSMRRAVQEEVVAANLVALQLLQRTALYHMVRGTPAMLGFLQGIGRVRSNDILLFDTDGKVLYQSPASTYKAGRDAPRWFDELVAPPPSAQFITFPDGKLEMRTNASRAVLDAWDESVQLLGVSLALVVLLALALNWLIGRDVKPLAAIVDGLNRIEGGRFETRLPALRGAEAGAIGSAFNRMAARVETQLETERRAIRAESELSDRRELSRWVDRRIEVERRAIARELHDEFGQSVTAVRSMALSIARRTEAADPTSSEAARTIADETSRLYEAMRSIIPRLAPMVLDDLGLADALRDLVERSQRAHPQTRITLVIDEGVETPGLDGDQALAVYRVAQEGLTNALRHGQPDRISLGLSRLPDAVMLQVRDDGRGPATAGDAAVPRAPDHAPDPEAAHYGLRWLGERVAAHGGSLNLAAGPDGGAVLTMKLPSASSSPSPSPSPSSSPLSSSPTASQASSAAISPPPGAT